jgi:NAD(P)-dependent dehydrogenase (short-subunit alcohol dehydrogenase family)
MTLQGKNIVVTGAGRGLGAAFAVVFADLGATVTSAPLPKPSGCAPDSARARRCSTSPTPAL